MDFTICATPILKNLLYWVSLFILKVTGWRMIGHVPEEPKFILIAAPHTSNWDLPITLYLAFAFKLKIYWMGKDSLFRFPFGGILKWLGGIPIDRSKANNMVEQSIAVFHENEKLTLVVPPEGTRKKVRYWKTGFYYIAKGAGVPIGLGFLDYGRKEGGFGPSVMPTDDIEADMAKIRAFYADKTGKYVDQTSQATITERKEKK